MSLPHSPAGDVLSFLHRSKTLLLVLSILIILNLAVPLLAVDTQRPGLGQAVEEIGEINGRPVRDNDRNPLKALNDLPSHGQSNVVIVWIGNSQQHSINQPRANDELASVALHKILNGDAWPGKHPVFGMSYPTLSYSELFSLVYALAHAGGKKPDIIILGLRFQDTKELGFRKEFMDLLAAEGREKNLRTFIAGSENTLAVDHLAAELDKATAQAQTNGSLEGRLSALTEKAFPLYRDREKIRGKLLIELHWLRNRAFGITPTTKRPILKTRHDASMQYLKMTLEAARQLNIRVLAYNIPLRQSSESPYDELGYDSFRQAVASLCREYDALYRDYHSLIPEPEWGILDRTEEPDFMHFTGAGHRRLAETVSRDIQPLMPH